MRGDADPATGRRLAIAGLAVAAVALIVEVAKYLHLAGFALRFPYGIDYGEGIVWQQMASIVAGRGYAPIGVFPAIVFHYPPVYHLTVAGFAAIGGIDRLIAGRLVSFGATLLALAFAGMLAAGAVPATEARGRRVAVGLFAALCPLAHYEVMFWSVTMRVDMLAVMLGLAGVLLVLRSFDRPILIHAAALAFTLAVYTKQTSVAAPAAAFVVLLLARPGRAVVLLGDCLAMGLAALAVLSWQTQGGFLTHIVLYNVNRFDPHLVAMLGRRLLSQVCFLGLAAFGVAAAWRRLAGTDLASLRMRLRSDPPLRALLVLLAFLTARAAMLPMMLKSGASSNYMLEWDFAVSMFVALATLPLLRFAAGETDRAPFLIPLLVAIGIPYQVFEVPATVVVRGRADDDALVARVRAATRPVVSDDMVLLIRAGRPVLWEPAIAAELAAGGRYDERAFAAMVRARDFAFFLTEGNRGSSPYDQRYNPVVADAIDAAYPVRIVVGEDVLHLPR